MFYAMYCDTFNRINFLKYSIKNNGTNIIVKTISPRRFLASFLLPSYVNFTIVKKIYFETVFKLYQHLSAKHNHCRFPQ